MGLLIGRGLPGKFDILDILLNALSLNLVGALLAGRSHVGQPGIQSKPRAGSKDGVEPGEIWKAWGDVPVYLYHMALTGSTFTGRSESQH